MSDSKKIAVVSGGSSGIGLAFVNRLHQSGYLVFFCGRDEKKLKSVEAMYPGSQGVVCDVSDMNAVLQFTELVLKEYPSIDLLISNAGGARDIDLTKFDIHQSDLTEEIHSNLIGAIQFITAFIPALQKANKSALVVITSGYALAPATRAPIYSAAKAGLRSFTKALRKQLAPTNVLVMEVAPPLVDTPAVAHLDAPKFSADRLVDETLSALEKRKTEVYPGNVRILPLLLRLAPRLAEKIVGNT